MKTAISIPIHSGITYFYIWLFRGTKYQGGDETEARGTDDKGHCLISHRWHDVEKLTTGSSNLKVPQIFVLKKGEGDFSMDKVKWFQMRFQS